MKEFFTFSLFRFHARRITYQRECVLSYRALTVLLPLLWRHFPRGIAAGNKNTVRSEPQLKLTLPNEVFVLERNYTTLIDTLCIQLQAAYIVEGGKKCMDSIFRLRIGTCASECNINMQFCFLNGSITMCL